MIFDLKRVKIGRVLSKFAPPPPKKTSGATARGALGDVRPHEMPLLRLIEWGAKSSRFNL